MKRIRDPLGRIPLTIKLPLAFVLLGVLAFGSSGMLAARTAQSALEQQIMRDLRALSAAHAQAVDHRLALLGHRVEDFCSDGAIRTHTASLLDGALERDPSDSGSSAHKDERQAARVALEEHLVVNKLALVEEFVGATVTTLDGAVLAAVGERLDDDRLPRDSTALWYGPLFTDPAGTLTFVIASPVWDLPHTKHIGVLVLVVDAVTYAEHVRLPGAPTGDEHPYRIDVIDPAGHRLPIGPKSTSLNGNDEASAASATLQAAGDALEHEAALNAHGWRVQLRADRALLLAPVDALVGNFLLIGLFVLLATSVAIGVVVQFVLRPLGTLSRAARRIASGDLNADLTVESRDEIGELARTLTAMVAAVRERSLRLEESVEQTRKQELLTRQQRDRLEAVIRSMHEALFIVDSSGSVTLTNPPGERLLEALPALHSGREGCARTGALQSCLHCLSHWSHPNDACLVRVGPRTHEISVAAMITSSGHAFERVYLSRDVTERIAQADLQAHQERMAVVGKLAAVVAHELNNPLAAIRMFSQTLETELPVDEPSWREYASIIRRNTETCAQTIQGLLDSAGSAKLRADELDLFDILDDVTQLLSPLCRKANVTIDVVAPTADGNLVGDERQLRQVFMNLIMNAVQAAPRTGSEICLTCSGDGDTLTIDVRDTGAGIAADHRAYVFKPFFTTKPSGVGTGLGLSTSRQIARTHGGDITLDRAEPGDTVFRVTLARVPAALTNGNGSLTKSIATDGVRTA